MEYKRGDFNVTLTVREATLRDRLRRNATLRALQADPAEDEEWEHFMYRTTIYATLTAVTDIEGLEVTPESIFDLPDDLVAQWVDEAVEKNPHLFPFFAPSPPEETSTTTSPDGS